MHRLGYFLKPRWLILAGVVAVFTYLCFVILAPWQLGKNTETEHRNDLISEALDTPTAPLGDVLVDGSLPADREWRSVELTGSYVQGTEVVVRLRSTAGSPSYEILEVFRTTDGTDVVVNRGYVLPDNGNRVPAIEAAPTGTVTLDGRVRRPEPTSPERPPLTDTTPPQVYSIAPDQVAELTGTDPIDGWIALADAQPGGLGVIGLPQLDAGPYLSYGLQWLAFGIMAPLGLGYVVYSEIRERRAAKATASGSSVPVSATEPVTTPADSFATSPATSRDGSARAAAAVTTVAEAPAPTDEPAPKSPSPDTSPADAPAGETADARAAATRDKLDARYGRRR
ncbi:SURF1 family cytochrome oxidase biogenesis protein [Millisia brevis]|uniref:SURF1 family cytochrome oxidase biogenesis protein n=1 Tax=Millisia brevis TaxID=264148 RepID=UPI000A0789EA|nr:SURF1 family protein [Millisia brevis]